MKALTDESIMPFGKYKKSETAMANVPAGYFLYLYEKMRGQKLPPIPSLVFDYIMDNMEVLRGEVPA